MNSNRHPDYFSSTDNESEPPLDSSSSKCTYVLLRVEDLSAREINSNQLPPPPPLLLFGCAQPASNLHLFLAAPAALRSGPTQISIFPTSTSRYRSRSSYKPIRRSEQSARLDDEKRFERGDDEQRKRSPYCLRIWISTVNRNKGDGGKHSVILGCLLTLFFEGASFFFVVVVTLVNLSLVFCGLRTVENGERERRLLTKMIEMDIKWSFDGFQDYFPVIEVAFLNVWFLSLKLLF